MDMEYENLVRRAFGNVGRWGDPLGLANADVYRHGGEDSHRLIFGISYALKKVIKDSDPNNLDLAHSLDALDNSLWENQSVDNINRVITEATELLDQHNIR
ncbi:hypothetical protein [Ekhidna sp.]|uniref:hypothetical protein n=1 Tax=Ekhidna sp. TaxID=2608089 RepID=UPI003B5B72BF